MARPLSLFALVALSLGCWSDEPQLTADEACQQWRDFACETYRRCLPHWNGCTLLEDATCRDGDIAAKCLAEADPTTCVRSSDECTVNAVLKKEDALEPCMQINARICAWATGCGLYAGPEDCINRFPSSTGDMLLDCNDAYSVNRNLAAECDAQLAAGCHLSIPDACLAAVQTLQN